MSHSTAAPDDGQADPPLVDPRAPRFGQAITASALVLGVVFQAPAFVYAVAAILVVSVVSRWRLDLYAVLWRRVVLPAVEPATPEPAAPHRFAKLMGATGTALASALLVAGVPLAGYAIAGLVAMAAGLAATTGICLGCRMYRSVSFFHRFDVV